ncbi:tail fiber domain-containing protein [Foetidibacter luteolus]|uniref:tail fiber domain-containing protein n=1 Tax=Foetidibacter luteolus TaxID=2608880 RepID=UPI00129BB2C2|nr:tail fiber domain-containing protein [Foetidibacter luteolus]
MINRTCAVTLVTLFSFGSLLSYGQANQSLSNLSNPTTINQHLTPNITNTRDLGTSAIGWRSIYLNSRLFLNGALTVHAPATGNFFAGPYAGNTAATGESNTSLGHYALDNVTTGSNNTGLGFRSLNSLTTGTNNTALGFRTLYSVTTASGSTAVGYRALYSNTTGGNNSGFGFQALQANTTGAANTAGGYSSLYSNTTGSANTGYGYLSLYSVTTGYENSASGASALYSNTTGEGNTAGGYSALYANTTGYANTATGRYALYLNSTGFNNSAYGDRSLYLTTTGDYNTAVGTNALYNNSTGNGNTAVGFNAGSFYSANSYNLYLGYATQAGAAGVNYSAAIGYGAVVNASNKIQLGTSTTVLAATGGVTIVSDGRFKDNVKSNDVPGLAFINKLQPVTYNMNYIKYDDFVRKGQRNNKEIAADAAYQSRLSEKSKAREAGFIAQEVEKLCKEQGYTFNGVYTPQNENDNYGIDYSRFVVPLVKAVQELSQENAALRQELAASNQALKQEIDALKALIAGKAPDASPADAYLKQNIPNPFNNTTSIQYSLPAKFKTAQIVIFDASGKSLQQINISKMAGPGIATINAATLSSGAYSYSLVIDGKIAGTKKMILSR